MKRSPYLSLAALLMAAMTLSACIGNTPTIEYALYNRADLKAFYRPVAGTGRFVAVVYGNPTNAPKKHFDSAVLSALQKGYRGPSTRFTSAPDEEARAGYHVEVHFASDTAALAGVACAGPGSEPSTASGGTVRMVAAFCFQDQIYSKVRGRSRPFTGPGDPALESLVASAARALFPPQGQIFGGGGGNQN